MNKTIETLAKDRLSVAGPETEPSDEELLLRYRDRGDQDAFHSLVHRYERQLYSYLRRYLGDASLAEDVFQATFLQLHLKSYLYEKGRPVRPWLYTIATHQAIDALRKSARHPTVSLEPVAEPHSGVGSLIDLLASERDGPLDEVEEDELAQRVRQAVEELPDHLRSVVVLVYYQGMKYRETAEVLRIPVGTVKSRLHAALAKVAQAWKQPASTGNT